MHTINHRFGKRGLQCSYSIAFLHIDAATHQVSYGHDNTRINHADGVPHIILVGTGLKRIAHRLETLRLLIAHIDHHLVFAIVVGLMRQNRLSPRQLTNIRSTALYLRVHIITVNGLPTVR